MDRSPFQLVFNRFFSLVLILGITLGISWGSFSAKAIALTSVDPITENYKIPAQVYVKNCGTCHSPIPPEVLPRETWQFILEKPNNHYGLALKNIIGINQVLMWRYLGNYSRSLLPAENRPLYINDSRYFRALHPKVELPPEIGHRSCLSCHQGANEFNYRD